ncbi:sugar ABC transporter ATP-binding protein [Cohnella terricola]|uniref:Sugar ABC transporter ATP-binding protein n=1 Tax=Cohnella terricola TaxID=1289167 RepID=A0A559JDR9_9BACL|nr:sugar ABC transporter ATP-binding protein [Cohnella terricola]TVX98019.1 sugar ABC transporter ATP-binding protein [Cohnella terricola]
MILEMKGISKAFYGVKALQDVSFGLKKGEVHALVGENGAGKSTLMKILAGIYEPEEGEIVFGGKPVRIGTPQQSRRLGISVIHQELQLVPHMTVAENVFLGRETKRAGLFSDRKEMEGATRRLLDQFGLSLNPQERVANLGIGARQIVEIAKALSMNAEVLVMDEPTAVLEEREANQLFELIHRFKQRGVSIVYISHRLHELKGICDRITVLRDGRHVTTRSMEGLTEKEIANLMVGRELKEMYPTHPEAFGDEMLKVEGLTRRPYFEDIRFHVKQGEIIGFAGLIGAGRTELMRTLFGDWRAQEGTVIWKGSPVYFRSPMDAVKLGWGFATEDRKGSGLLMEMNAAHNMTLSNPAKISRWNLIRKKSETKIVNEKIRELNINAKSLNGPVKNLSGGNQQKVVIAKWLVSDVELFILDEPTRGIDVGARGEIYNLIATFAQEGKAVIVVSSELPELIGLCNRIYVMHHGKIKGELCGREANEQNIMAMATGL